MPQLLNSKQVSRLANRDDINLNTINASNFSGLMLAILFGHTEIELVCALLARGKQIIPVNSENLLFWMPFEPFIKPAYHANTIYLSDSGEYKVFNIHGEVRTGGIISFINVNLEGPQYDKPINIAAQHGHLNIVRELLQQPEIDLNYRPGLSKPTLLTQIVRSKTADSIRTLELILEHPGIDVNLKDDIMMSPLCTAVRYGNINTVVTFFRVTK